MKPPPPGAALAPLAESDPLSVTDIMKHERILLAVAACTLGMAAAALAAETDDLLAWPEATQESRPWS
jgi:hypothetical protein